MEIVINPKYSNYKDFVKKVPEIFPCQGTTIYKIRNEIKTFEVEGTTLNVKKYKVPFFLNRIIYTFFRAPKAIRAYQYAKKLYDLDIATADPIAYIMFKKNGLIEESYFISKQIDAQTMYEAGKLPIEQTQDLFKALARYVAQLHRKGVFHADFSPGNILYKRKDSANYEFYIIDINRMNFGPVSLEKGCSNFARLWGSEAAFRVMAKEYALQMNADPDKCTGLILSYRDKFWIPYRRKRPIEFTY